MKTSFKLIAVSVGLLSVASASQAAVIGIYNTGVDSSGATLPAGFSDPHWSVDWTSTSAKVLSPGSSFSGGWLPNDSTSAWIGKFDDSTQGPAGYTFNQTFSLAGFNPTTAVLSGVWYGDDSTSLILNGHVFASTGYSAGSGTPFTINDAQGWFKAGQNTLSVRMDWSDQVIDGVRVVVSGIATPVPEPSTVITGTLLLLPFGVSTLRNLRRKS